MESLLDVLLEQHVDARLEDEPVVDRHLADLRQLVPVPRFGIQRRWEQFGIQRRWEQLVG